MIESKRKKLLLITLTIGVFLVIVFGATFAFFATARDIDASTPVNARTASKSYTFIASANETIEFNLSATEMSEANVNENVLKSDNANIYMEVASATDNETTTCTYDIQWVWDSIDKYTESDVTLPHTDGDKSYPYELSISVDGENETDLSKLTWNDNKAIVASGLEIKSTSKAPVKLTHNIEVKSYNIPVDQQKLYNKNFRAHLEVVNNSCSATTKASKPAPVLPKLLIDYIKEDVYEEDGVGGLYYHDGVGTYTNANLEAGDNSYRYSGQYSYPKASEGYDSFDKIVLGGPYDSYHKLGYDETNAEYTYEEAVTKAINDGYLEESINNYICFKEGCTDDEKYRIIGVIDGKVKVIKMTDINTENTIAWNDKDGSSSTNTWEGSTMETYLNGTYIGNLKTVANLETDSLIDNTTWHVGGMEKAKIESPNTVKDTYTAELSSTPTIERKIGLMYASDYGYAAEPTYWSEALIDYESSEGHDWMLTSSDWTISCDSTNSFLAFNVTGYVNNGGQGVFNNDYGARPVFSLSSSVKLKSGSGTSNDPFIVGL